MMRRLAAALGVVVLLGLGLGLLARGDVSCDIVSVQPQCYVAMHPGPTEDTLRMVEIDGERTYSSTGEMLLTTVRVDPTLDLRGWLGASFSREVDSVRREVIYPPGSTTEDVRRRNLIAMGQSQIVSAAAALRWLGYDVDLTPEGARVAEVMDDYPAGGKIQPGDVIRQIDRQTITDAASASDAISERSPGETIALLISRGGEEMTLELELAADPHGGEHGVIGVLLRDNVVLPVDVRIEAGNIGGPSAGLMFALAVVDLMTAEDLTGGAVIAGTGSVDVDGRVGAMGGVRQKIVAATTRTERPAEIFLVPSRNVTEARRAPVGRQVLIVPVDTLDDAIAALHEIRAGREPAGSFAVGRD